MPAIDEHWWLELAGDRGDLATWYSESLAQALDTSNNLTLRWTKTQAQALDSKRWRARGEQQADKRASAVDVHNMFCLLETTIHFVHANFFYFDKKLLQYRLQYESYSYNI
jgi:hypothetical protein